MSFAELSATTNFTFLTGASHPEEMVERAAELGLCAIALADRNTLAGVVRAHVRLRELKREEVARKDRNITGKDVREHARIRSQHRVDPSSRKTYGPPPPSAPKAEPPPEPIQSLPKLIIATRLSFTDSAIEITALVPDRKAYAELTRLLTLGKRRAEKGGCALTLDDFLRTQGLLALIHLPDPAAVTEGLISKPGGRTVLPEALRVTRRFKGRCWLAATPRWDGRDGARIAAYARLADQLSLDLIAANAPLLHRASRRRLADVLTCIRERCTMAIIGTRALPNSESRLRSERDMLKLFVGHEAAVHRTAEIAARCTFSL
ncbi:MAG: PHP domain-containing protein, partial [Pseudomonadota bacterium]